MLSVFKAVMSDIAENVSFKDSLHNSDIEVKAMSAVTDTSSQVLTTISLFCYCLFTTYPKNTYRSP